MPQHLLVEPMGTDIVVLGWCMVIDAVSFPRPGVVFARDLARPTFRAWVCRSTDSPEPWGFLGSHRAADTLHITALASSPEHRRQGVATALLRTAMLYGKQSRLARVSLEVHQNNTGAIQLYERLGFSVAKSLADYYGPGEDAVSMVLPLRGTRRVETRR